MELVLMGWVCKAYTLPSGRLVPQTRNVQNSCPTKILQSMRQKLGRRWNSWEQLQRIRGNWTSKSIRPALAAAEVWGSPRKGASSVEEPPQVVNCCSVWHWLMHWWCLVLQVFGVSPFIHEGWGCRSPSPEEGWTQVGRTKPGKGFTVGRKSCWLELFHCAWAEDVPLPYSKAADFICQ